MKLPTKPKTNTPPTLPELEAKRSELTARLADVTAQAGALDPLADWERAGSAAAQQTALQNALDALDAQLVTARRLAADEARAAAEAAKYERELAAIAGLRSEARAVTAIVQHLEAGAFKALDEAYNEAAAAGALPVIDVGPVVEFRLRAAGMIAALRDLDPVLVGEAPRPSAAELALNEAKRDVQTAEAHLAELSQVRYGGNDRVRAVEMAGQGLELAQKRLAALEGKPYAVQALQSRISLLLRSVPQPQPESELVA